MRFRKMQYSSGIYSGRSWQYYLPNQLKYYSYAFVSDKYIADEVHAWPPPHGSRSEDVGGSLQSYSWTVVPGAKMVRGWTGTNPNWLPYNYDGPVFASVSNVAYSAGHGPWAKTAPIADEVLLQRGATAISRCAPTNPHASLSQAIGELRRDGIPAIPALRSFERGARPTRISAAKRSRRPVKGQRTRSPSTQKAGSEYLNIEFGWKPLLSDIRKLATAQRESERILTQYVRDSGRLVRRRYEFPSTLSTTVTVGSGTPAGPPLWTPLWNVPYGKVTTTITVERRMWFTGAFTYHVSGSEEILGGARRSVQMANHLTGAGISPGVLWDLTPWSWAADWIGNTGDVLNNVSMMQTDGLVVVYGYIMAETVTTKTVTNEGARLQNGANAGPPLNLTQIFTETVKQRRRATPFGFGLDVGAFTPRQLAIVAALGLSRDGRKLAI